MQYRGTDVDQLIAAGNGRLVIGDGASLEGLLIPKRLSEVTVASAAYLDRPLEDPAVAAEITRHYHQVSAQHVIARNKGRPEGLITYTARHHPRRLRYAADATTRAIAHLTENPKAVACQFSAAALLGITHFADAADSALYGPYSARITTHAQQPTLRRAPRGLPTWNLHLDDLTLTVTPPMLTLAHCLRAVLNGEHAWHVPGGLPHTAATVRAVQLIDRYRREFSLSADHLTQALEGLINRRALDRLLRLTDDGADSPPETLLRLIARHAAPELQWVSQVPVYADGSVGTRDPATSLLTVLDLACLEHRRYLYYDGEHHLDRAQRDKDALITALLSSAGWVGIRVTAGMLETVHQLNGLIRVLVSPENHAA
ncbi:hypothetical protein [Corynebacterium sp.]|uniref:hypothetical protein n=1 Tax=Corynebacterium sp. TaxID=1720 RepID=UPI0026DF39DC|nr:hypothetical protein [Corynebacterium sp.]MDO5513274.1 hypothetical protein [Corynebacterium sp.]